MGETAKRQMEPQEFLEWCLDQEDRYELVDGFPVKMMAGATEYHDQIVANVIAALHGQLRGKLCRVQTADIAIRTKIRGYRRPDVMVTCNPPRADALEAAEPRMVVEVLSKSNAGLAWQRKLEEYRRREGLKYILLIDSRAPQATLLTRGATDGEPIDADDLDAVFDLPEIGCRLPMRDIYEGLTFGEEQ